MCRNILKCNFLRLTSTLAWTSLVASVDDGFALVAGSSVLCVALRRFAMISASFVLSLGGFLLAFVLLATTSSWLEDHVKRQADEHNREDDPQGNGDNDEHCRVA